MLQNTGELSWVKAHDRSLTKVGIAFDICMVLTVFSDTILFSKAGGVPRTVGSAVDSLNATPEKHYMQNTTTKITCNAQVSKPSYEKQNGGEKRARACGVMMDPAYNTRQISSTKTLSTGIRSICAVQQYRHCGRHGYSRTYPPTYCETHAMCESLF